MPTTAASNLSTDRFTTEGERWRAVEKRDAAADGRFFYSVRTTGVYCKPSCGSRMARRENVRFHRTAAEAERSGFRACKRCRPQELPDTPQRTAIAAACRLIEAGSAPLDLATLASAVGMSRFHFHRMFKKFTGQTPKAYAAAHRGRRLREELIRGGAEGGVARAVFAAGYNSSSPVYADREKLLGMTPSSFRAGGGGARIRFAVGQCSLGAILVAATEQGVCEIALGDDASALIRDLQDRFQRAELIGGDREFERVVALVVGFVEAPRIGLDLPLDIRGTVFQHRVWQELAKIPAGSTATYAEVARRLGAPRSTRAVAAACAANRLAVAIPCHRVIRTDGALAGYRWGVDRKRSLLAREAAM